MVYQGLILQSKDGQHIDKKTFLAFFKYPGMFGERVFHLFDVSERGYINCDEFIGGLARFLNGTTDEKIQILFKLYDLSGTNAISYEDLTTILYSLISMPYIVPGGQQIMSRCRDQLTKKSEAEKQREPRTELLGKLYCQHKLVNHLASEAFKQNDRDPSGTLSFKEFHHWIKNSPEALTALEVSFAQHLWAQPDLESEEKAIHWASQLEGCCLGSPCPAPPTVTSFTVYLDPSRPPHGVHLQEASGDLVARTAQLKDNILYLYDSSQHPESIYFLEGLFVSTFQDTWSEIGYTGFSLGFDLRSVIFYIKDPVAEWLNVLRTATKSHPIEETYVLGRQLGQGRNSVHLATHKVTGKDYAAKIIRKNLITAAETEALRAEVAILKLVSHPNIIYLQEVFEDRDTLYLIMPLMAGGDLFDALSQVRCFSELTTRKLIQNLLSALSYLHEMGIVHRDIKPENILLVSKESVSDIILADFGLSLFASADQVMKIACGTLSYVAPEVLQAQGYTRATDVWGVGVLCYLLLDGRLPFKGTAKTEVIQAIIEQPLDFEETHWASISSEAKDFISRLLQKNPAQRATVHDAIAHPWFQIELSESITTIHPIPSISSLLSEPSSAASSDWREPSHIPSFSFTKRRESSLDSCSSASSSPPSSPSSPSLSSVSSAWREPSRLPTFSMFHFSKSSQPDLSSAREAISPSSPTSSRASDAFMSPSSSRASDAFDSPTSSSSSRASDTFDSPSRKTIASPSRQVQSPSLLRKSNNQFDIAKQESVLSWSAVWKEPSKVDFSQLLSKGS